jgi:hypothetical protein
LLICRLLVSELEVVGGLVLTAPHTDITSDADTAALLCNHTAQCSALGEAWELLRREDDEGRRPDFQAMRDMGIDPILKGSSDSGAIIRVHILRILQLLVEGEAQSVFALMANRQVREDEVACRARAVQIGHAGNRCTGEHGKAWSGSRSTTWGNRSGILESS